MCIRDSSTCQYWPRLGPGSWPRHASRSSPGPRHWSRLRIRASQCPPESSDSLVKSYLATLFSDCLYRLSLRSCFFLGRFWSFLTSLIRSRPGSGRSGHGSGCFRTSARLDSTCQYWPWLGPGSWPRHASRSSPGPRHWSRLRIRASKCPPESSDSLVKSYLATLFSDCLYRLSLRSCFFLAVFGRFWPV